MIKSMNPRVVEAITNAVHAAIAQVGIDGLRGTSMFPSSSKVRVELPLAA
jgi:hypothetical protein